jgi:hypothetical protein
MKALFLALRTRPPLASALFVFAVLLATTDERSFGVIPDGREMLSAGAALAFHGEMGVSRDFGNAVPRPGGDAFSRYGLGQSLAEIPFLWAARVLHAVAPSASSAPLLVLLPILSLTAAAWGLARAAGLLGASPAAQLLCGAGLVLSTHLWGYSGSDFSEPLQAGLLGLGLAALAVHRTSPSRRSAFAAAALLGALPLVKSLLWIVTLPLAATLFLRPGPRIGEEGAPPRRRGKGNNHGQAFTPTLLLGAAIPAAVWLVLELVRFGRPFGGYPGEDFSYPALTGLLRLTLLPNKGLLFYAPVCLLAVPGLLALRRRDPALALGLAASIAAVFASAARWWAWDGQAAWGPRLITPALVPLLLLVATGYGAGAAWRRLGAGLFAAGAAVNLVGALQPFPAVYSLVATSAFQPIAAGRAAGTKYEIEARPDGTLVATPAHHLSLTPSWWPPMVHARVLRERRAGGEVGARLASGSLGLTPPLAPQLPTNPAAAFRQGVSAFAWPFWGRSWFSPQPGLDDALSFALRDQAVRDLESGRPARAYATLRLVLEREAGKPQVETLALAANGARRAGLEKEAAGLLARSPVPCHPWILFVRIESGEDVSRCVPPHLRASFRASVEAAIRNGWPVSLWERLARRRVEGG